MSVNFFFVGTVPPGRQFRASVCRRALELLQRQSHHVTALAGIIFEGVPRERVISLSDTEKSPERHDGIGNLSGHLIDHDVMDLSQPLTAGVIDACPLDLAG